MRKSLYAFYINEKELDYSTLSRELAKFVEENSPGEEEETEGFINFAEKDDYISFSYYRSYNIRKVDPRGLSEYIVPVKEAIPIGISKSPFMLLVFARNSKIRDKILEYLPIDRMYRIGVEFTPDFIEFANVPEPPEWREKIFRDDIEPRGRKGKHGGTHELMERYSSPEEREKAIDRKYVFRDATELVVSLEDVSVRFTIYQGGRMTVSIPGRVEVVETVPYVAKAVDRLSEAQREYDKLKFSVSRR